MRKCFGGLIVSCSLALVSLLAFAQQRDRDVANEPVLKDLKPIGGKWFVTSGDKPVYYYRDGERFVDLFSYHRKDSNKDGIENVGTEKGTGPNGTADCVA